MPRNSVSSKQICRHLSLTTSTSHPLFRNQMNVVLPLQSQRLRCNFQSHYVYGQLHHLPPSSINPKFPSSTRSIPSEASVYSQLCNSLSNLNVYTLNSIIFFQSQCLQSTLSFHISTLVFTHQLHRPLFNPSPFILILYSIIWRTLHS